MTIKQFTFSLVLTMLLSVSSVSVTVIDFEDQGVAPGSENDLAVGVGFVSGGFRIEPGPNNYSRLNDLHIHNQDGFGDNGGHT